MQMLRVILITSPGYNTSIPWSGELTDEQVDLMQGFVFPNPDSPDLNSDITWVFSASYQRIYDEHPNSSLPSPDRISVYQLGALDCVKVMMEGLHQFMQKNPNFTPEMLANGSLNQYFTPDKFANTGSNIPPSDGPVPEELMIDWKSSTGIAFAFLLALGIVYNLALLAALIVFKNTRAIRSMSPTFTTVFTVGTIIINISLLYFIGPVTAQSCALRILLAAWHANTEKDGYHISKDKSSRLHVCVVHTDANKSTIAAMVGYIALMMASTGVLSYFTSSYYAGLSETSFLSFSFLLGLVGFAVTFSTNYAFEPSVSSILIQNVVTWIVANLTLLILYLPKLVEAWLEREESADLGMRNLPSESLFSEAQTQFAEKPVRSSISLPTETKNISFSHMNLRAAYIKHKKYWLRWSRWSSCGVTLFQEQSRKWLVFEMEDLSIACSGTETAKVCASENGQINLGMIETGGKRFQCVLELDKLGRLDYFLKTLESFYWELAVNEINQNPNILPHTFVNLVRYNNWDPDASALYDYVDSGGFSMIQAMKLVQNNVTAAVGEYFSRTTIFSGEIFSHYQIPLCGTNQASPILSDKTRFPYFFRTQLGKGYGRYLFQLLKWANVKKVAIIMDYDALDVAGAADTVDYLTSQGVQVLTKIFLSYDTIVAHDYNEAYATLKNSDARYFIFFGYDPFIADFMFRSYAHGLIGPRYVWIGWNLPWPEGNYSRNITTLDSALDAGTSSDAFQHVYKAWTTLAAQNPRFKMFGELLPIMAPYDCANVMLYGLDKNPQFTPEMLANGSLKQYLNFTAFQNTGYDGVMSSQIKFNENGDLAVPRTYFALNTTLMYYLPKDITTGRILYFYITALKVTAI
ncbi:hypothetical protein HDU76_003684 [Blyttiomyces sp. JEL0837]|nr:hypothetical protein HDU76_003684 [Blyttiomyces sp. JEL0837]